MEKKPLIYVHVLKNLWLIVFAIFCLSHVSASAQSNIPTTVVTVEDNVWLYDVKKFGINIGAPDRYGASQILKNVIHNPGFEAGEFGTIFLVDDGSNERLLYQDNWKTEWNNNEIGQPVGFWDSAEYEVISGPQKGQLGTVTNFEHNRGQYAYGISPLSLGGSGGTIQSEDAILVRKAIPGFEGDINEFAIADIYQTRPGSPGKQSLNLRPTPSQWEPSWTYYMDSYWRDGDPSAGKLFFVDGNWRLEFWAKAAIDGTRVDVQFERERGQKFFFQQITLSNEWKSYKFDFYVPQGADYTNENGILKLSFNIKSSVSDIWLDDSALYRTSHANRTVFTDKFVNNLRELQPGILRNWGNQLGSSLDNQLATPWARKTTAYSPADRVPERFHYSLHEFLVLCQELNAEPWYVVPPTFTEADLQGLIAYLSAPAGKDRWADRRAELGQYAPWTEVFDTIHIEFGNEMWGGNDGNDQFIGATMRGGERLGEVSHDRISIMKSSPYYEGETINFIIGGQVAYPARQGQIEASSDAHDTIALAPYYGILDVYSNDDEIFYPLFSRPTHDTRQGDVLRSVQYVQSANPNTDIAIYEINFHTTTGNAPLSTRNGFVSGLNGGLALPLYMMTYQQGLGIRTQAAFTALQYSIKTDGGDYAKMWGLLRDIEATGTKRPGWHGLYLANRAVRGDMLITRHSGFNPSWKQPAINGITAPTDTNFVQSFAYKDGDTYALALFNLNLYDSQKVVLDLPNTPDKTAIWSNIYSDSIHHNNESDPLINVRTTTLNDFSDNYEILLPPHSFHVIEWGEQGQAQEYIAPTDTPEPLPSPSITPIVVNAPETGGSADQRAAENPPTNLGETVAEASTPIAVNAPETTVSVLEEGETPQPTAIVIESPKQETETAEAVAAVQFEETPTEQFELVGGFTPDPTVSWEADNSLRGKLGRNKTLVAVVGAIGIVNFLILGFVVWILLRRKRETV